jgi:hypothetical protein
VINQIGCLHSDLPLGNRSPIQSTRATGCRSEYRSSVPRKPFLFAVSPRCRGLVCALRIAHQRLKHRVVRWTNAGDFDTTQDRSSGAQSGGHSAHSVPVLSQARAGSGGWVGPRTALWTCSRFKLPISAAAPAALGRCPSGVIHILSPSAASASAASERLLSMRKERFTSCPISRCRR